MDFTYIFAFVVGAIFALVLSLATRLFVKNVSALARAILMALISLLILAISINWPEVHRMPILFMILDFGGILTAAWLGALFGTLPIRRPSAYAPPNATSN